MDITTRNLALSYNWSFEFHEGDSTPLPVVDIARKHLTKTTTTLYIGFGNGRNARPLLEESYDVYACDASKVAVSKGQTDLPSYKERIQHADFRDAFPEIPQFDAVILSRALIEASVERATHNLRDLSHRVKPDGLLLFQLPAIGTDLWPAWSKINMDCGGNITVGYPFGAVDKLYLSFNGATSILSKAGFQPENGPVPADVPRLAHPGGLVRNWLGTARKRG